MSEEESALRVSLVQGPLQVVLARAPQPLAAGGGQPLPSAWPAGGLPALAQSAVVAGAPPELPQRGPAAAAPRPGAPRPAEGDEPRGGRVGPALAAAGGGKPRRRPLDAAGRDELRGALEREPLRGLVQSALSSPEVRRDRRLVRNDDDAGWPPGRRAPVVGRAPPPIQGEQFSWWSSIWSSVTNVFTTVWSDIQTVMSIPEVLSEYEGDYELGGHSESTINTVTYWTFAGVILAVTMGALVDTQLPSCALREGRPRWWVLALLASSYTCLAVGLSQVLFSMIVAVKVLWLTLILTEESDGSAGATTESMISVIGLLWDSGATLGALLVVLYAMILPAVKLLLLMGGEVYRFSPHASQIAFSRGCVRLVQVISKWACPDMFAYILTVYLIRGLDDNTSILETDAQLDVGFMLFSVFCIGSTISSLAVRLPGDDQTLTASPSPPAVTLVCGRGGFLLLSTALAVACGVLLAKGLQLPVMSLTLDTDLLGLPSVLETIVDYLGLEDAVSTDVSLTDLISKLWLWAKNGESMSLLGLVMFAVFAIGLTCLDMLVLLTCTLTYGICKTAPGQLSLPMGVSRILRHLAMLDVAIMGIWVVCLATSAYKDQGVVLTVSEGLYYLLGAEIAHYATYYVVSDAVSSVYATEESGPLDGRWRTQQGNKLTIKGERVTFDLGDLYMIEADNRNRFSLIILDTRYWAQLVGGRLNWNDGDTWTPLTAAEAVLDALEATLDAFVNFLLAVSDTARNTFDSGSAPAPELTRLDRTRPATATRARKRPPAEPEPRTARSHARERQDCC